MEYASFILGVLSVIFILMVVGMFRINRKLEKTVESLWGFEDYKRDIEQEFANTHRRIDEVSEMTNRRIDGELDRLNQIADDIHRRISNENDNIYRTMDSRFDKFETKIKSEKTSKQILKD